MSIVTTIPKLFALILSCFEAHAEPLWTLEDTAVSLEVKDIIGGNQEVTLDLHLHLVAVDSLAACLQQAIDEAT